MERPAPLFFVSPAQINYIVPPASAAGAATLSVISGGQLVATGSVQVAAVAPGLFTASMDGRGAAAAWGIRRAPDLTDTYQLTFQCGPTPGSCVTSPIDLGAVTDQAFLSLHGTGIRGRSAQAAVSARIGGIDSEVTYVGPQGFYPWLDQVNVRLPRALPGRGEVDVAVTVDGAPANTVRINIR